MGLSPAPAWITFCQEEIPRDQPKSPCWEGEFLSLPGQATPRAPPARTSLNAILSTSARPGATSEGTHDPPRARQGLALWMQTEDASLDLPSWTLSNSSPFLRSQVRIDMRTPTERQDPARGGDTWV